MQHSCQSFWVSWLPAGPSTSIAIRKMSNGRRGLPQVWSLLTKECGQIIDVFITLTEGSIPYGLEDCDDPELVWERKVGYWSLGPIILKLCVLKHEIKVRCRIFQQGSDQPCRCEIRLGRAGELGGAVCINNFWYHLTRCSMEVTQNVTVIILRHWPFCCKGCCEERACKPKSSETYSNILIWSNLI